MEGQTVSREMARAMSASVSLEYLPESIQADAARLQQLAAELRLPQRVNRVHRTVCIKPLCVERVFSQQLPVDT